MNETPVRVSAVWVDDNSAWIAVGDVKVGALIWNGAEWWFHRVYDNDPDAMGDPRHLPIGLARAEELRLEQVQIARDHGETTVGDAILAEFEGRVAVFRDETREAAVFMARTLGRRAADA